MGDEIRAAGTVPSACLARLWPDRRDRVPVRPPHLLAAANETPTPTLFAAALLQQLATQGVYCVLTLVVAAAFGLDGEQTTGFLCLTLLSLALGGLLQASARGPLGSGYALSLIPTTSLLAPYLLAAKAGASLGEASLLCVLAGLAAAAVVALDRRLLTAVPPEIAGIVTFAIGISLLPRALETLGPEAGLAQSAAPLAAAGAILAGTCILALLPDPFGRFALPVATVASSIMASLASLGAAGAGERIAAAAWLAIPVAAPPPATAAYLALLPAFLLGVLVNLLSWQSVLLVTQRAGDAGWRRPDAGPIRRGLLAASLAVAIAGGLGAMAPGSSSAGAAFAIHARVLSRSVAVAGSGLLLLLACMPKAATLLVAIPPPVQAALLLYMGCFMMAGGCQTIAARVLDTRRTLIVGLALAAALLVPVLPPGLLAALPLALRSPVMAGAAVALVLHVLTLPLIAPRATFHVALGPAAGQDLLDLCARIGGSWGVRKETLARLDQSLSELAEVLGARGEAKMAVRMRLVEDTEAVKIQVLFAGPALAWAPGVLPRAEDLLGDDAAQERFMLWMALRHAEHVVQRRLPDERWLLSYAIGTPA